MAIFPCAVQHILIAYFMHSNLYVFLKIFIFVMLCSFQMGSKVNQLHIYISTLFFLDSFPIQAITDY